MRAALALLLTIIALLALPAAAQAWHADVTYSPFVTWSLSAAQEFAGSHYGTAYAPGCPPRNGRPFGVNVWVVDHIGEGVWRSAYGGYSDLPNCRMLIGVGSWWQVHAYEAKHWGLWMRRTTFCPLIGHEYAHFVLRDGSHRHTPNLDNPDLRARCGRWSRVHGWNRAYHSGVRHG